MNESIKTQMKAAFINQYGSHENLQVGTLDTPQINADQVLIKVAAAGVNPVDFHIRNGMLAGTDTHQLPLVLGWDLAGEVVQIGNDVSGINLNDQVFAFTDIGKQGTYSEYVAVDAELVRSKPNKLNMQQAAAVPLAAVTAWQALTRDAGLNLENAKDKKVFIQNASGGVGGFAVQIAHYLGAHVIASASGAKEAYVKSLGADEFIDYKTQDFSELVEEVDIVLAAIGGQENLVKSLDVIKPNGQLISTLDELPEGTQVTNNIQFTRMWVKTNGNDLGKIAELIDAEKITVHLDSVYPLEEVKAAHQRSEAGKATGKIVLNIAAYEYAD
ncbi:MULTISPECIES: NADP-dependent oxidoreductase [unclassified Marinomonas]|uniref:NADP-dependent oxidoreductase n=1 Tax=unclassified Marinomonas TaxID=196814 RepID=UPI000A982AA5|nr:MULTISPECIES: NADP-dependent oxidoreductase [unclassified Marinomonas]